MRWIEHTRQHLNVTALEARAFLIVATALLLGYGASRLSDTSELHEHATALRIEQLLDSLHRAGAAKFPTAESHSDAPIRDSGSPTSDSRSGTVRTVNLNTASVSQLDALPGVGPATANAIADARRRNRFTSVDDLLDVKGIGEKKLERIRPYVTAP
jgi:competence protein ComEA